MIEVRLSNLVWMMSWLLPLLPSHTQGGELRVELVELAPSSLTLVWSPFLITVINIFAPYHGPWGLEWVYPAMSWLRVLGTHFSLILVLGSAAMFTGHILGFQGTRLRGFVMPFAHNHLFSYSDAQFLGEHKLWESVVEKEWETSV